MMPLRCSCGRNNLSLPRIHFRRENSLQEKGCNRSGGCALGGKMVYYGPMRHLFDSLRPCAKEEEVKAEFCKFFRMKVFALRGIDH